MSEELRSIGRSIHGAHRTLAEWTLLGREVLLEHGPFVGRFDSFQNAFCFSYYDTSGTEYRFQFSLDHAFALANGADVYLEGAARARTRDVPVIQHGAAEGGSVRALAGARVPGERATEPTAIAGDDPQAGPRRRSAHR